MPSYPRYFPMVLTPPPPPPLIFFFFINKESMEEIIPDGALKKEAHRQTKRSEPTLTELDGRQKIKNDYSNQST
ncbi:hypothetical protein MtrunA17_Chr1g0160251 [Medicago truncatula]|uniref:Uncharacterized protein n=1 Tax=Medicago truncatula TaxID=3880 RepID=A0A396JI66_MEDTR|nr:hypothetical protein MtrunA17_Chr1g0160251 [Medicago truncatula]